MGKQKKENQAADAPDPARSVGRMIGLCVGVAVGLSAAITGLVAGVPAPDLLLRALIAGVLFKILAGWCGAAITRGLIAKPEPAAQSARAEGER
jgi:hypothetical protein